MKRLAVGYRLSASSYQLLAVSVWLLASRLTAGGLCDIVAASRAFFSVASVTSVISKLREDDASAAGLPARSQGFLRVSVLLTAIIFASRDNFPTSAISVSLRQHTPQRSLPPPRSPGLTLICFSLRLSVSAVNILWLRRRRAVPLR